MAFCSPSDGAVVASYPWDHYTVNDYYEDGDRDDPGEQDFRVSLNDPLQTLLLLLLLLLMLMLLLSEPRPEDRSPCNSR